jgi:hypothetical protein
MTKKPSESSKEPSKSSSPLSKEQAKRKREALVAMHKRDRKWGRTVTEVAGPLVQGSLFDNSEQKEAKPAVLLASDVVAPASDEEVQMKKISSESSEEPSESSPPPEGPTNSWPEAIAAWEKRLRDSGTTVTDLGPLDIQGSQFIFPGRKARRPATPPASDVVAPASDEEVQMTKKPPESSKEPSKSSDPPPKEPTNSWPEAAAAWRKRLRDSGTIVKDLGPLDIQGSQFIFPARKARKNAAPLDDDVKEATDRG